MISLSVRSIHNLRTLVPNIPAKATCHAAQTLPVPKSPLRKLERVVSSCANGLSRGLHWCGFVGFLLLLHGRVRQLGRVVFDYPDWLSWD